MVRLVWMWVGRLHKHGKVQATPAIAAGIRSQNMRFKAIACLLMLSAAWVLRAPALSAAQPLAAGGQSADMEAVSGLGGPGSVPETLDTDRQAKGTEAARVDYVEAYFDFKISGLILILIAAGPNYICAQGAVVYTTGCF